MRKTTNNIIVRSAIWLLLLPMLYGCARQSMSTVANLPFAFKASIDVVEYPFQVVYADGVFKEDGQPVDTLSLLKWDNHITLTSGYLIIAHYLGEFFEYSGDTTVLINQLISTEYGFFEPLMQGRPRIENLYSKKAFHNIYDQQYSGAVVRSTHSGYFIDYVLLSPYENKYAITKGEKFCLWWQEIREVKEDLSFKLKLVNIFDEVLDTLQTKEHQIELDFENYDNVSNLYLIQNKGISAENTASDWYSAKEIAIEVVEEPTTYIPNGCRELSALKNLELGFYLENNGYPEKAAISYERSTQLSDKKIYQTMFELFNIRTLRN